MDNAYSAGRPPEYEKMSSLIVTIKNAEQSTKAGRIEKRLRTPKRQTAPGSVPSLVRINSSADPIMRKSPAIPGGMDGIMRVRRTAAMKASHLPGIVMNI
jgi:hypothetical protein